MEFKVHCSLRPNYHHVTFAKFNVNIHYLLPCEWKSWHCHKNYVNQTEQAISEFPWDNRFANIGINKKVQLLTQTIQNIRYNYIPHETITCDDRSPPWIGGKIRKIVLYKNSCL